MWLLCRSYNPHKSFISQYLSLTIRNLGILMIIYDNIFLMGNFNVDKSLKDFCPLYNLKHLIKVPSSKNMDNPSVRSRSYVNKLSP